MRARLNQVRARPKGCPGKCCCRSCRHFRRERLHAGPLRRRGTHPRQRRSRRVSSDGPREWLGVGVVRTRRESPRRSETAAQLTHDHQRSGHGIWSAACRRKREIIREVDGQALSRGNCNHNRGPAGRCRRGRQRGRGIQIGAGGGGASHGRAATVAPHVYHCAIGHGYVGRPSGQIDLLLAPGHDASEQKNTAYSYSGLQRIFEIIGSHGFSRRSRISWTRRS